MMTGLFLRFPINIRHSNSSDPGHRQDLKANSERGFAVRQEYPIHPTLPDLQRADVKTCYRWAMTIALIEHKNGRYYKQPR